MLGDEVPVLADFAIEHPLVLPEAPRPIQTVVTPEGPGTVSVAIMSLEDEASDRWILAGDAAGFIDPVQNAASEDSQPRRAGWWSRRFGGGE